MHDSRSKRAEALGVTCAVRLGISVEQLLSGQRGTPNGAERYEDLLGWAEAAAQVLADESAPRYAVLAAGKTVVSFPLKAVDAHFVYDQAMMQRQGALGRSDTVAHADADGAPARRARTQMVRVAAHRSRRGLLDAAMRRSLAAELREIAPEVRMFDPPVELAVGAGFEVAAKRGPTSDKPSAAMVVYAWNRDRRRRGLRVYVGLARAFLLRLGVAHDWHDVWLLALELAVPHHMLGVGLERTLRGQRHCPEHVIREVFAARWL